MKSKVVHSMTCILLLIKRQVQFTISFCPEPLIYKYCLNLSIFVSLSISWGKGFQVCEHKLFRLLVPHFVVLYKFTLRFDGLCRETSFLKKLFHIRRI